MDAAVAALLVVLVAVAVLLFRGLRRHTGHRNHCPYPNPVLGNVVPFVRNFHRFLDWATDQLAAAPASTIEVRGALGLGNGVATADPGVVDHLLRAGFPNYVKGARFAGPFADLLASSAAASSSRTAACGASSASSRPTPCRPARCAASPGASSAPTCTAGSCLSSRQPLTCRTCSSASPSTTSAASRSGSRPRRSSSSGRRTAWAGDDAAGHDAFFKAFDDAVEISFARMLHPTAVVWKSMRLAGVGSERRLREAIRVVDEHVAAIMESEERSRGRGDEQHLLSRFAAAMEEDEGSELGAMFQSPEAKRRFLRDIVVSFVLAGKDSTSSALTWFFWLLAANPRCERRVYKEAAASLDENGYDDHSGYDELRGMHYLHAAITEAMRLYPPVPINSRVAAAGDVLPDGTTVRAGWFSDYCAYAMGRMPRLWGDDCREFRPERWLDGGGEFVAVDAARYPVFHAGPRACLGKEMAYVQMKTVVAAVVRRFSVEPVRPASMGAPPSYEMAVTLRMKGGLPVRIRRRENDAGRH